MQKTVSTVSKIGDKFSDLDTKMAGLLDWKSAQERRMGVLETWKSDATSMLSQAVLSSRFDVFVQSRFAETDQRAQQAVSALRLMPS